MTTYVNTTVHANFDQELSELSLDVRSIDGDFVVFDVTVRTDKIKHTSTVFLDQKHFAAVERAVNAFNAAMGELPLVEMEWDAIYGRLMPKLAPGEFRFK